MSVKYKKHVSLVARKKPIISVTDPLVQRPDRSAIEASQALEMSDVETKRIILSRLKKRNRRSAIITVRLVLKACTGNLESQRLHFIFQTYGKLQRNVTKP